MNSTVNPSIWVSRHRYLTVSTAVQGSIYKLCLGSKTHSGVSADTLECGLSLFSGKVTAATKLAIFKINFVKFGQRNFFVDKFS